jgi:hypothetical protein
MRTGIAAWKLLQENAIDIELREPHQARFSIGIETDRSDGSVTLDKF